MRFPVSRSEPLFPPSRHPELTTHALSGLTRRHFLRTGAAVVAGVSVGASPAYARTVAIPPEARRSRPTGWLPDPPGTDQLRTLAVTAMDAATAAGADFADIRIGVRRQLRIETFPSPVVVSQFLGYGIRAWVGGTWSFQHGNVLTTDALVATARSAVAGARRYAGIEQRLATHRRHLTTPADPNVAWAAAAAITGEWHAPVEIDPFVVSVDDLQRAVGALRLGIPESLWDVEQLHAGGAAAGWDTDTRVFASTANSVVTQSRILGGIGLSAAANAPDGYMVMFGQEKFKQVPAGFETILRPELPEEIRQLRETVAYWQELPFRPLDDVGRFPVVLDGRAMARVFGGTADLALDGDRVSGLEADASGDSFLAPPLAVLASDTPSFSPLLSAHVDRALPSPTAVQWDDDGVTPESYTVLERGRVVDFHTTRETAPMLAPWYERHGRPVRSHGGAVASTPENVPCGMGGHLTVSPAPSATRLADLMREVSHGFLVINGQVGASPGLTAGRIEWDPYDGLIVEIRRGVPVARTNLSMQFTTKSILGNNLRAIGSTATMDTAEILSFKGMPWQGVSQWVTAPAALCVDVDVIR